MLTMASYKVQNFIMVKHYANGLPPFLIQFRVKQPPSLHKNRKQNLSTDRLTPTILSRFSWINRTASRNEAQKTSFLRPWNDQEIYLPSSQRRNHASRVKSTSLLPRSSAVDLLSRPQEVDPLPGALDLNHQNLLLHREIRGGSSSRLLPWLDKFYKVLLSLRLLIGWRYFSDSLPTHPKTASCWIQF